MPKQSQIDRLARTARQEMDASTTRLADKLRGELASDDASNVSQAGWHEMIVRNWADPAWREAQAQRLGPVAFVQDAMRAHGLNPALLKQQPSTPAETEAGASQ